MLIVKKLRVFTLTSNDLGGYANDLLMNSINFCGGFALADDVRLFNWGGGSSLEGGPVKCFAVGGLEAKTKVPWALKFKTSELN